VLILKVKTWRLVTCDRALWHTAFVLPDRRSRNPPCPLAARFDYVYVRGFLADLYLDGMRLFSVGTARSRRDLVGLVVDRVRDPARRRCGLRASRRPSRSARLIPYSLLSMFQNTGTACPSSTPVSDLRQALGLVHCPSGI
jgi:hypothetical protein